MEALRHLGFLKAQIFNDRRGLYGQYMRHRAKFSEDRFFRC